MVQGAITTVIALLYAFVPSVSSAYWILSVMTTQVYLIVYLLMFVAAVKLRRTQPNVERGYTAPALSFLCVVGFIASAAAILIGFVPPSQFENGSDAATSADPGRHGAARPATAVAVPEVPQTQLEVERVRGGRHERDRTRADPEPTSEVHRTLYWITRRRRRRAGIIGLITYSGKKEDQGGRRKAKQLTQAFQRAGLRPPDPDIIVRSSATTVARSATTRRRRLGRASCSTR